MQDPTPEIKTIQGRAVPSIGFGTFQLKHDTCHRAVQCALESGYRHIDTARMYANEREVGRAMNDSGVSREDVFLTSKVWIDQQGSEDARKSVHDSLSDLGVEFLDLVLIHWPVPEVPLSETLGALTRLQDEGKVRHVGVSNFPSALMTEACEHAKIFCNQVEYHPVLGQEKLLEMCHARDILLAAYAPLGHGSLVEDPVLAAIGRKHGKTAAQVALRWLVEQPRVCALPRSSNPERIKANLDVFDFALDEDDHQRVAALPKDKRGFNPPFAPKWD